MIYLGSIFSHLPNELTGKILDSCEARGLATLPQVCSSDEVTKALTTDAWKRFEAGLGYSSGELSEEGSSEKMADPNSRRFREYNNLVKDLVVRIKSYTEEVPKDIQDILDLARKKAPTAAQVGKLQAFIQARDLVVRIKNYSDIFTLLRGIPTDIQEILDLAMKEAPTVEQVDKLQAFIKARDTLVVWLRVAVAAGIEVDGSIESGGFSKWMKTYYESLQTLTELFLVSGNELTSIPKELGQLHNLEVLYLSSNQLRSIPKELGQLHNLRHLHLDSNQLKSIPEELGQLHNLEVLYLASNQLRSIPKELGQLHDLKYLDLSYNQLKSIPESVRALPTKILIKGNPCASTVEEPEDDPIPVETRRVLSEKPVVTIPSGELGATAAPVGPVEASVIPEGSRGYGSILAAGAIAVLSVVWMTHEEEFLSSISSVFAGSFWE